ncbi:hypothetical protein RIF29_08070 [Crotalaria pallida]|uniref:Uncharacterized protein n=1 Tax=Crotalaria pallida TaxID=3830 RepID=A0AAN9PCC8_CROPI
MILRLSLSLYLVLLLSAAAADSGTMNSKCKTKSKRFEEGWPVLRTGVNRIINQIEEGGGLPNSTLTTHDYMSYYNTVYELCTDRPGGLDNSKLLYHHYKNVFEEYINSTVLPSLRGKKDEVLLRELLRRWANHKIMTSWLTRLFHYLERYDIPRWGFPSLEETSFLSFYNLVYDEMNNQIVEAILSMIDQERAGQQIERTLVNNTLAIYSEIGDGPKKNHAKGFAEKMIKHDAEFYYDAASIWMASSSIKDNTPKEEKMHDSPSISSKKINLISSDGDAFEVDYAVALMSQTIEDVIKTIPGGGDTDSIPLSLNSKSLAKAIEYCEKHTKFASNFDYNERSTSNVDLNDWDAEFVKVDHDTLFDFVLTANYLNIKSLLDLASCKIADMIKGKTPEEIRKTFDIKNDDDIIVEEDQIRNENKWAFG